MVDDATELNGTSLETEIDWFATVLATRLRQHLAGEQADIRHIASPDMRTKDAPYADFINHYRTSFEERLIVVLALVPHIRPALLDGLLIHNESLSRGYTEFGGLHGKGHGGFLPTGETALFLLAGNDLALRFQVQRLFDSRHYFAQHGILALRPAQADEPHLSGQLSLSREYLDYFTLGRVSAPSFGQSFPAKRMETTETWDDLVLEPEVMEQVEEIRTWIHHGGKLMDELGFARRMKPGFRSLFFGPPGTGKSMTAALLGNDTGRDLYRIDLSMVVSKYIGETEKNLAEVFDRASHHDWILFFDEADALFGKRTSAKDAHDRYANQEVAYLLQRVEEFGGVVILASNLRDHIDDAFTRRFHSIIHFPMPRAQHRLQLWQNAFTDAVTLEQDCDLAALAPRYEISGGAIMNAARYAALMAVSRGSNVVASRDLERGVRRELQKEGRTV